MSKSNRYAHGLLTEPLLGHTRIASVDDAHDLLSGIAAHAAATVAAMTAANSTQLAYDRATLGLALLRRITRRLAHDAAHHEALRLPPGA